MNSSVPRPVLKRHAQASAYDSPWTLRYRVGLLLWECAWAAFCRWTPKPFNRWRLFWLRLFGCKTHGRPFVHQRARIHAPWNLTLHDRACLGDGAVAYSLDRIEIEAHATVAQEAYLCTGSHDFALETRPLTTAPIRISQGAFVGARAFVLPGVTVGPQAIVGACAVLTKDAAAHARMVGNPAREIHAKNQRRSHEPL